MGTTKGHVLVVDDEAYVRETVRAVLEKTGFAVTTAEDGPEALELVDHREYDVILLDLRMPGMDGMDVFRELKNRSYSAEIIFLTAFGTITSAVDALKLGALDYLVKPGAIHDLPAKTLQAVEMHRRKKDGVLSQAITVLAQRHHLTPKQAEVCRNLIAGRSNADIARQMGISEHTVKTHLKRVFERLEVDSRTELAAKILENIAPEGQ